ncbi:MAG TPA: YtxH domain-containing protein [Tissierellia bacterium]|nr:YtxH domain-containing protein [Tissierellia bacterium]
MNNNGFRNGAFIGSVLGLSLGMVVGSKVVHNIPRKKIMRTARRAKSTLMNGMNSLWR